MEQKNEIGLEKVLTISAKDYCEMYRKKLEDYEVIGVHLEGDFEYLRKTLDNYNPGKDSPLIEGFLRLIPTNSEVIVGLNSAIGGWGNEFGTNAYYIVNGTALIPKQNIK